MRGSRTSYSPIARAVCRAPVGPFAFDLRIFSKRRATAYGRAQSFQDTMLWTARQQAADLLHRLKTPNAVLQAVARDLGERHESHVAQV
jgi:hypothetical protein